MVARCAGGGAECGAECAAPRLAAAGLLCQSAVSYLAANMADTKGISRLVLKQAGRAKEKVRSGTVYWHSCTEKQF